MGRRVARGPNQERRTSMSTHESMKRRKFDPAVLFEPLKRDRTLDVYPSLTKVLDAVRDRKKAMYYTGFPLRAIAYGDEGFADLIRTAVERDLTVIIHNRRIPSFPLERQEPG